MIIQPIVQPIIFKQVNTKPTRTFEIVDLPFDDCYIVWNTSEDEKSDSKLNYTA